MRAQQEEVRHEAGVPIQDGDMEMTNKSGSDILDKKYTRRKDDRDLRVT